MREVIVTGKTVDEAIENGCRELGLSIEDVSYEILEMPIRKFFKTIPAKVKVTPDEDDFSLETPEVVAIKDVKIEASKEVRETVQVNTSPKAKENKTPPIKMKNETKILVTEPEIEIDLSKNSSAKYAVEYLTSVFSAMGSNSVEVKAYQQGDATLLRVEGEDLSKFIETRGETIQALSYLTDRAVNKGVDKRDEKYIRIRLDVSGYRSRRETELISLAKRIGSEVIKTKKSRTLAPMNPYERLIIHTTISQLDGVISESTGSDSERRVIIKSTAPDAIDGEDWKPSNKKNNYKPNRNNKRGKNERYKGDKPRNKVSTPNREYADKPRNSADGPVVPARREAISDGENLPLYGKIDL